MTLYLARWAPDENDVTTTPLLLDASSREVAITMATDVAEGLAPATVVALPSGSFVAELVYEPIDEDGKPSDGGEWERMTLLPLDHTEAALAALDDAPLEKVATAVATELRAAAPPAPPPPAVECTSQAVGPDGAVITCQGGHGPDEQHRWENLEGVVLKWSDEP